MHVKFVYIYYFHGYIIYHLLCSIFMYCYHVLFSCTIIMYCFHILLSCTVFMYCHHVLFVYFIYICTFLFYHILCAFVYFLYFSCVGLKPILSYHISRRSIRLILLLSYHILLYAFTYAFMYFHILYCHIIYFHLILFIYHFLFHACEYQRSGYRKL